VNVDLFGIELCEVPDIVIADIVFRQQFAIEVDNFVIAKDDRGTEFQHPLVREYFNNAFQADPVQVACCDTYYRFLCTMHHNRFVERVKVVLLAKHVYVKKVAGSAFPER
jgi:hypothetical protein